MPLATTRSKDLSIQFGKAIEKFCIILIKRTDGKESFHVTLINLHYLMKPTIITSSFRNETKLGLKFLAVTEPST